MEHINSTACRIKKNYWISDVNHTDIYPCPVEGACIGGTLYGDNSCSEAYAGKICRTCRSGYGSFYFTPFRTGFYESNGVCIRCPSTWALILLLFIICCAVIKIFFWQVRTALEEAAASDEHVQPSAIIMQAISHMQMLSMAWEIPARGQIAIKGAEAPLSPNGFGLLCLLQQVSLFPSPAFTYAFILLFFPVSVFIILYGYTYISYLRKTLKQPFSFFMFTSFYVFYFTYYSEIVTCGFKLLTCINVANIKGKVNDAPTMYDDARIRCSSAEYKSNKWIGIALIVVYGLLIPLLFFIYMLFQRRKSTMSGSDTDSDQFLNLVLGPFKQKYWYWEFCSLIRKLFFCSIVIFQMWGKQAKFLIGVVVLYVTACSQIQCNPYRQDKQNDLESFSLRVLYITLTICAIILYMKEHLPFWRVSLLLVVYSLNFLYGWKSYRARFQISQRTRKRR